MEQAINGEELVRPYIGVRYMPVTPAIAEDQDLPVDYGALVSSGSDQPAVIPGSPAEAAGVQAGDVIVAVDGEQISVDTDLSMLIVGHDPGDTVTLRVLRGNSAQEIEVTLGELPSDL
jgi:S1-C subfamily serine protease